MHPQPTLGMIDAPIVVIIVGWLLADVWLWWYNTKRGKHEE